MHTIKRAIYIAAGEGRRLQPVTLETPKPLVKVNGQRIMDRSMEALFANGIEEVYIVVGYKKEQFYKLYGRDPRIHIIENPDYLDGNNITSIYYAREHLKDTFILEGDLVVYDSSVLRADFEKSGYLASQVYRTDEWVLELEGDTVTKCMKTYDGPGYRLWGISMWTAEDGARLAKLIEEKYKARTWDIYWDEVALFTDKEKFSLGIREIDDSALLEIDTFEELAALDPTYEAYRK